MRLGGVTDSLAHFAPFAPIATVTASGLFYFQRGHLVEYDEFLKKKTEIDYDCGFNVDISEINPILTTGQWAYEGAIVKWAVRKGRAALFEDCGLGKSKQQVEWIRLIRDHKKIKGLIVCPLSVAEQTIEEAASIGIEIKYAKSITECPDPIGLYITNYERLDHFSNHDFGAIVLDESSILKGEYGKTKTKIFELFKNTPYRLSCTATPSPNDIDELKNQVEFLGIMSAKEMESKFFVNDSAKGSGWRLKGHSKTHFYRWMATWCVFIRKPSDIGFSDEGFELPPLNIQAVFCDSEYIPDGELFPTDKVKGLTGRIDERRRTIENKIAAITPYIKNDQSQWIVWTGLNDETKAVSKAFDDVVTVKGEDSIEFKSTSMIDFKHGKHRILNTKGKIAGFGMNFQNSHNAAFIGLSDSFEMYYQLIRRQYRFGQPFPVNAYIVITTAEQSILSNVLRKEKENAEMIDAVVKEMSDFTKDEIQTGTVHYADKMEMKIVEGESFKAMLGDSCETIKTLPDGACDFQIFSPPFFSLYTYSPSIRDMGNSSDDAEFWTHFQFLIPELLRVLKRGRLCAVHCMQVPALLGKDGYIGVKDFRGQIIDNFSSAGFVYHGEFVIPKNPQAQSIRTHSKGLTFTQFEKDTSWSRPALLDYVEIFRKPGEPEVPIKKGDFEGSEVTRDDWIDIASGILSHVRETYTLNTIKYENDERHVCPLQLDVIDILVRLYTNPDEIVYSPFGGVFSEAYQSILLGRRAIVGELKPEYFEQGIENMREAEAERKRIRNELF
jgi:DNA modification methylase